MPVDPSQTPQAVMDPQDSAIQMPSAADGAPPVGAATQMKSPSPELQQAAASAAAQTPTAPSPEVQAAAAQKEHHSRIGKLFSSVMQGGSGSSASQMWR